MMGKIDDLSIDVNFSKFLGSYYSWRWRKFPISEFFCVPFFLWICSIDFTPKSEQCADFSLPVSWVNLLDIQALRLAFPQTSAIILMLFFLVFIYYIFLYRLTLPLLLLSHRKVVCACRRRALWGIYGLTTFGEIVEKDDQVYFVEHQENLKWYSSPVKFKYVSTEHLLPLEVAEKIKNNPSENLEFDFELNGRKCSFKVF